jgi:polyferredoxin
MLGYLGLISKENMQIEGFFFYLLSGLFSGAVIHYLIAKVFGPVLYGRGYCGWACWTAMVLDYLPFKQNKKGRVAAKWEFLRYIHFVFSLLLVLLLWFYFLYRPEPKGHTAFAWLVVGNIFYFSSAIILAFSLKDNRAFCKYLCPITAILKATSRFALIKIDGDKDTCTECGACAKACPMDINVSEYIQNDQRVLSTECIFCMTCTTVCPEKTLKESFKLDIGGKECINRRD